jgi:hypothetical protein
MERSAFFATSVLPAHPPPTRQRTAHMQVLPRLPRQSISSPQEAVQINPVTPPLIRLLYFGPQLMSWPCIKQGKPLVCL